jgi:hypothetical protein
MKRLFFLIPIFAVLAGCGTAKDSSHTRPILSHTASVNDVPLRLDVGRMHRVGRVASLDLRLANRGPSGSDALSIDDMFSADSSYDIGGVLMLDPQTGLPIPARDADSVDLGLVDLAPGGTQLIRAVFPAPRGETVDVLVPHFGLFRDVPVR